MDVNKALEDLRAWAVDPKYGDADETLDMATAAADLFNGLDACLSGGGLLPTDWDRR